MKGSLPQYSFRERYRAFVSLLLIPLGGVIMFRAVLFGFEAWTLFVLGAAMVGLGIVRLRTYAQQRRKKE